MPFVKGREKSGGRQPGTPNRATATLRELLDDFLSANFEVAVAEFAQLEGKDKVSTYVRLLEFSLPKMTRAQVDVTAPEAPEAPQMDYSRLSIAEMRLLRAILYKANPGGKEPPWIEKEMQELLEAVEVMANEKRYLPAGVQHVKLTGT